MKGATFTVELYTNSNTFSTTAYLHPVTGMTSHFWDLYFPTSTTLDTNTYILLAFSGMIYTEAETYYGEE
jgi:hypothetical protein